MSILSSIPAMAHGGGTDQYGCHTNSRTGVYHCHNSKDENSINWEAVGILTGVAVLVWLAVDWMKPGETPVSLQVTQDEATGDPRAGVYWKLEF